MDKLKPCCTGCNAKHVGQCSTCSYCSKFEPNSLYELAKSLEESNEILEIENKTLKRALELAAEVHVRTVNYKNGTDFTQNVSAYVIRWMRSAEQEEAE